MFGIGSIFLWIIFFLFLSCASHDYITHMTMSLLISITTTTFPLFFPFCSLFSVLHSIAWCWLYWNTSGIANYLSRERRERESPPKMLIFLTISTLFIFISHKNIKRFFFINLRLNDFFCIKVRWSRVCCWPKFEWNFCITFYCCPFHFNF